jgi:hypothetical protein
VYDKVWREDILAHAFALSRDNGGAPGVDGISFTEIEAYGVGRWLGELREEVRTGRYSPPRPKMPSDPGRLRAHELKGRQPGRRVKHRMKQNWIKMYDKAGLVLRVETVINQPEEFRVRRRVRRRGRRKTEWVPLRKSVAYLFRYREICLQCNSRYLAALALVEDPTPALRGLDDITVGKAPAPGRSVKAFNPIARADSHIFGALLSGDHIGRGFANRDLRDKLRPTSFSLSDNPKTQSAQVSRLLHRLHVYGLVAKIPRSRRWRVSAFGYRIMSASLQLRQTFTGLHAKAAA